MSLTLFGSRRRSVFPALVRGVLECDTYEESCAINEEKTGKKIPKQAWNIVPKVKGTDALALAITASVRCVTYAACRACVRDTREPTRSRQHW